jgi:MFS family permease
MTGLHVYWSILRDIRDFRQLYIARLVSFAGDWFLVVPLVGLVYEASDSPFAAAALVAIRAIPPLLLSPVTGFVSDRFDRKKVLVATDVIRAGLALSLLATNVISGIWFPFLIAALDGGGASFFYPASGAALPNVVPAKDLGPANVMMGSAWGAMAALGAALGGFVSVALSRDAAFTINAVSFVTSAILISTIRVPLQDVSQRVVVGFTTSITDALIYARDNVRIAALLSSKAMHSVSSGGAVGLFAVISFALFDAGDAGTGLLFGARGIGNLVGPIIAFRLVGNSLEKTLGSIGFAMAVWGASYLLVGIAPTLALATIAVAVGHMGGGTEFTFSTYGLQELSSDGVRGRVFALDFGLFTLASAISALVVGGLAEFIPLRALLVGLGSMAIVIGIAWKLLTAHLWRGLETRDHTLPTPQHP